jgi:hypothetical protein
MTEKSPKSPMQRIEAALADSPDVAAALAQYLEALREFERAAAAVVESVEGKPIWVPSLSPMPPTQGNA